MNRPPSPPAAGAWDAPTGPANVNPPPAPGGWNQSSTEHEAWDQATREQPRVGPIGQPAPWQQQQPYVPAPALPELPAVYSNNGTISSAGPPQAPAGQSLEGRPPVAHAGRPEFPSGGEGTNPVSPAGRVGGTRTGLDTWSRPEPERRRRAIEEENDPPHRPRRSPYGDEPAYGPVLGYTAGWFAVPALLYLIWLFTLDGDRQALVGRQFATSLPWLLAAVVLSLAVAGLLRWAVVGWRAVTLSFAAAVIGAGLTTIAHSLTL